MVTSGGGGGGGGGGCMCPFCSPLGPALFILSSLKVKPCSVKYILGIETAAGKLLMTRSQ